MLYVHDGTEFLIWPKPNGNNLEFSTHTNCRLYNLFRKFMWINDVYRELVLT